MSKYRVSVTVEPVPEDGTPYVPPTLEVSAIGEQPRTALTAAAEAADVALVHLRLDPPSGRADGAQV